MKAYVNYTFDAIDIDDGDLVTMQEGDEVEILSENGKTIFEYDGCTLEIADDDRSRFNKEGSIPVKEEYRKSTPEDFPNAARINPGDDHLLL